MGAGESEIKQEKKVLVVGGAGQAGKIHTANLLMNLPSADYIGCFDLVGHPAVPKGNFFDAKKAQYSDAVSRGFTTIIVALPDNILYRETMKILNTPSVACVLIEKPGALVAKELKEMVVLAASKKIPFFIDYQRSFDSRFADAVKRISTLVKNDGYNLDYVSIISCDKAQPPQAAPQALNQGCHDYAMLLRIFEQCGFDVEKPSVMSRGVKWGDLNDTKFLEISGYGVNKDKKNRCVFEVKMGRVSSLGTYTRFEAKLSKYDAEKKMYIPQELELQFPLKSDPNAFWSDTWKESFQQSIKAIVDFDVKKTQQVLEPVPAAFGVKVLEFAELVLASLK